MLETIFECHHSRLINKDERVLLMYRPGVRRGAEYADESGFLVVLVARCPPVVLVGSATKVSQLREKVLRSFT